MDSFNMEKKEIKIKFIHQVSLPLKRILLIINEHLKESDTFKKYQLIFTEQDDNSKIVIEMYMENKTETKLRLIVCIYDFSKIKLINNCSILIE